MIRIEDTPEEYRLRIVAEEGAELSQAALKLIRATTDHDTPVKKDTALKHMMEEAADVITALQSVLDREQWDDLFDMAYEKRARWVKRLNERC